MKRPGNAYLIGTRPEGKSMPTRQVLKAKDFPKETPEKCEYHPEAKKLGIGLDSSHE